MARNLMGFKQAAEYVYMNDDMSFLDDDATDEPSLPVSVALVADIFDRTPAEMVRELRKHHS